MTSFALTLPFLVFSAALLRRIEPTVAALWAAAAAGPLALPTRGHGPYALFIMSGLAIAWCGAVGRRDRDAPYRATLIIAGLLFVPVGGLLLAE